MKEYLCVSGHVCIWEKKTPKRGNKGKDSEVEEGANSGSRKKEASVAKMEQARWRVRADELKVIMGSWALERILRPLVFTLSQRRDHFRVLSRKVIF